MALVNLQPSRQRPGRKRKLTARGAWAGSLLALTGCSPAGLLTKFDRIAYPTDVRRVANGVPYAPGPRQKLDVWSPSRKSGQALPVVIFFYGGGWNAGSRGDYGFAGAAFASRQFIAVVPDYRLVPEVRFPAFVEDGALAVRWTRDNIARYGGDPNRITLAGHSAGAYNAAMLSLDPRWLGPDRAAVRGFVGLAGPYDFFPFDQPASVAAFGEASDPLATQPVRFASPGDPPSLLLVAGRDTLVYPRNARNLAAALRQAGVPVETRVYDEIGHIGILTALSRLFRGKAPVLKDVTDFAREVTAEQPEAIAPAA